MAYGFRHAIGWPQTTVESDMLAIMAALKESSSDSEHDPNKVATAAIATAAIIRRTVS